jgi:redox-sensitive bicupin YhaK (pirin superfamily)
MLTLRSTLPLLFSVALLLTPARAGEPLITNGNFADGMTGWRLNLLESASATATVEAGEEGKKAVHVKVPQTSPKRWLVQLVHLGVKLEADKTYHLKFRARCTPAASLSVMTGAVHEGKFAELSRNDGMAITEKWADYTCDVKPKSAEADGHLIFSGLAAQAGDYWFTDVTLTAGE